MTTCKKRMFACHACFFILIPINLFNFIGGLLSSDWLHFFILHLHLHHGDHPPSTLAMFVNHKNNCEPRLSRAQTGQLAALLAAQWQLSRHQKKNQPPPKYILHSGLIGTNRKHLVRSLCFLALHCAHTDRSHSMLQVCFAR